MVDGEMGEDGRVEAIDSHLRQLIEKLVDRQARGIGSASITAPRFYC